MVFVDFDNSHCKPDNSPLTNTCTNATTFTNTTSTLSNDTKYINQSKINNVENTSSIDVQCVLQISEETPKSPKNSTSKLESIEKTQSKLSMPDTKSPSKITSSKTGHYNRFAHFPSNSFRPRHERICSNWIMNPIDEELLTSPVSECEAVHSKKAISVQSSPKYIETNIIRKCLSPSIDEGVYSPRIIRKSTMGIKPISNKEEYGIKGCASGRRNGKLQRSKTLPSAVGTASSKVTHSPCNSPRLLRGYKGSSTKTCKSNSFFEKKNSPSLVRRNSPLNARKDSPSTIRRGNPLMSHIVSPICTRRATPVDRPVSRGSSISTIGSIDGSTPRPLRASFQTTATETSGRISVSPTFQYWRTSVSPVPPSSSPGSHNILDACCGSLKG